VGKENLVPVVREPVGKEPEDGTVEELQTLDAVHRSDERVYFAAVAREKKNTDEMKRPQEKRNANLLQSKPRETYDSVSIWCGVIGARTGELAQVRPFRTF
jgi:hypothetical protein